MYKAKDLTWQDPDLVASSLPIEIENSFFYLRSSDSDSVSYIGYSLLDRYIGNNLDLGIDSLLQKGDQRNFILSLLPYEFLSQIEDSSETSDNFYIKNNVIQLFKFSLILEFKHHNKTLTCHYLDSDMIPDLSKNNANLAKFDKLKISEIKSNFTDRSYKQSIEQIKKSIAQGEFYQTNLTRKYFGKLTSSLTPSCALANFLEFVKISPANYSCFVKNGDEYILCNSPELYLNFNDDTIYSEPIKGTAARSRFLLDNLKKRSLAKNKKEVAENLMIVDLVRNDLSRVSVSGTTMVEGLFKISTYSSYHHMSTLIKSKPKDQVGITDVIDATFPAGSMTGAPKLAAINAALEHEKFQRGIYSGAIGLINNNRNAKLNVVIRTIIINNDRFEFQVGGAITFDSSPQKELEEIFTKAKSICKILGINSLKDV